MENKKIPLTPVVLPKMDYRNCCRPELPIQLPKLPNDFNEMQNENENEFDILLADGEDNRSVHDVAEFHAVMNSIIEHLNMLIDISEDDDDNDDDDPEDVNLSLPDDKDFGSMTEQHSEDSGLYNSLNEDFIELFEP